MCGDALLWETIANNIGSKKYRHCPQVHSVARRYNCFYRVLDKLLREFSMVVKRKKLGYMWSDGFSTLVGEILGKNQNIPQLTMGGAGWQYDIDCVKIAGTTIIADPNASEGVLRVLDVGDPGTETRAACFRFIGIH